MEPSQLSMDWLNKVLIQAAVNRASDIHFEPTREHIGIRFRIDGLLQPLNIMIEENKDNVLSRIKVLAQMNITEHRVPQDGHYEFSYNEKVYNFRVSTLPTIFGEAIVFRILNREEAFLNLDDLGLLEDQYDAFKQLVSSKAGMVLATGPTGSGKSSLLYSIIHTLSNQTTSILTLEDPVEYAMENVRQTQINETVGLSFSVAMRSVLRQDPNYIMLGEIRDAETAQIAISAALSGITVFSTFHTFDVPFLINRFKEMGISRSVIAQAVKGVISTRLVRKICDACKAPYQLTDIEKEMWGNRQLSGSFMAGKGCEKCFNTGYVGRVGIYEIARLDQDIQSLIVEDKPAADIYQMLKSKKILTLREAGYLKVAKGETTMAEIVRVLGIAD